MRRWIDAFRFAWQGIYISIRQERHIKFHLAATIGVSLAGWFFGIARNEWILLLLMIGIVWISEMINTAIETLCNKVEPAQDPYIKTVKDIAAGAVLIAAIIASLGGILLFTPYLQSWIGQL